MQDKLNQFKRKNVWKLVPRPKDKLVIDTRWVFRNKLDEDGIVTTNKANWFLRVTLKNMVTHLFPNK